MTSGLLHLNSDLKILARILTRCVQIFVDKLFNLEQSYVVTGRTIQDNLHLVCPILDEIDDGTGAEQVNLDQSNAFYRVVHHFLEATIEVTRFRDAFVHGLDSYSRPPMP